MNKAVSWLFILTGLFAIIGALFSWGSGWLFDQPSSPATSLIYADLILAGPLAVLAGILKLNNLKYANAALLTSSGLMIYGSVQVWVMILMNQVPNNALFWIPSIFGFALALIATWHCLSN